MKIAITGHTKGVGKSIFDRLSSTHEVFGFSRTNGYNIQDYKNILLEIKDFDVFINNTYFENYQELIFSSLFKEWKDKDKTIVNILNASTILNPQTTLKYSRDKTNLFETIKITLIDNPVKKCRVINLLPSTIEPNPAYPDIKNKLDPDFIARQLEYTINTPQDLEITCMVITPTAIFPYPNTII